MQKKIAYLSMAVLLTVSLISAQSPSKPTIQQIGMLPSDPIVAIGSCKSSTGGYLERNHHARLNKAEIGDFISSSLQDGYIVTIYPPTKRGIFVAMECTNTMVLAKP
jgi:hypothetical protein